MPESFPRVRKVPTPSFLPGRFPGGVPDLLRNALSLLEKELPPLNDAAASRVLPTFDDAFAASDDRLLQAVDSALGRLAGDEAEEARGRFLTYVKRLMVFENPAEVRKAAEGCVKRFLKELPQTLADLENPRGQKEDVLDPFMVAFNLCLFGDDDVEGLIRNLFMHKCLMKMENLLGNLHQEVLGRAAGKQRVPEPKGKNKQDYNAELNPYPGADARLDTAEFYEIKSKTGSATGGAGAVKIGKAFLELKKHYPGCRRFYVSLVGRTLTGHRSKGAFLRTDPEAVVLVGLQAFQQLGGHHDAPYIAAELYMEIFQEACEELEFNAEEIIGRMAEEWRARYKDDPVSRILWNCIAPPDGDYRLQDSKTYDKALEERKQARAKESERRKAEKKASAGKKQRKPRKDR